MYNKVVAIYLQPSDGGKPIRLCTWDLASLTGKAMTDCLIDVPDIKEGEELRYSEIDYRGWVSSMEYNESLTSNVKHKIQLYKECNGNTEENIKEILKLERELCDLKDIWYTKERIKRLMLDTLEQDKVIYKYDYSKLLINIIPETFILKNKYKYYGKKC